MSDKSKNKGFLSQKFGEMGEKIGLMAKMNRSTRFTANGRKTYRTIGALIILIGGIVLLGGQSLTTIGNLVKERYEKKSGKFIRNISEEDRGFYEKATKSIKGGIILKTAAYFILFLGVMIVLKPELLFFQLKRMGFEKGGSG